MAISQVRNQMRKMSEGYSKDKNDRSAHAPYL